MINPYGKLKERLYQGTNIYKNINYLPGFNFDTVGKTFELDCLFVSGL